ncbi:hypothetical protein C0Q70_02567 [Pomacea canaliculata]|uniref:Uncharacterized protein n=1 Tax=Pomacea canaliculata TaxID=400727 RepID=A0A2T7PQA4_POMCA|nr:hypothetical protein C0Q70_02567 [Pomacea canaliculata]
MEMENHMLNGSNLQLGDYGSVSDRQSEDTVRILDQDQLQGIQSIKLCIAACSESPSNPVVGCNNDIKLFSHRSTTSYEAGGRRDIFCLSPLLDRFLDVLHEVVLKGLKERNLTVN